MLMDSYEDDEVSGEQAVCAGACRRPSHRLNTSAGIGRVIRACLHLDIALVFLRRTRALDPPRCSQQTMTTAPCLGAVAWRRGRRRT
jgi:hypothetical protein